MERTLIMTIVIPDADAFERSLRGYVGSLQEFANLPFHDQLMFLQSYQTVVSEGVGTEIVLEEGRSYSLSQDEVNMLGSTQPLDPS